MKKNLIALLIVALVAVGLFAANAGSPTSAEFKVTTTVSPYNLVSVTSEEFTGATLEAWNTFLSTNAITDSVPVAEGTLAWANVISNNKNGVDVYITASKMTGAATGNNYKVDYTAYVNGASFDTSSDSSNKIFLTAANSKATTSLFIGSYEVTATLNGTSLNNAPQDTYTGTITFTFTAQ